MQRFPCPFCGARSEPEFLFIAEMGKIRPAPAAEVPADAWSAYLHESSNGRGAVSEIWQHLPCGLVFAMQRDSTTMRILSARSLRKEGPE